MIGVKDIIQKLNDELTSNTLTELEINQLYSAIDSLEKRGVSSVKTASDLPNPVTNKGRFIFIDSENRYVFSNGEVWNIDFIIKQPYKNLWAWGFGSSGQLGTNNTTNRSSPVSVLGGFTDWVQVDAGNYHSLGLRANGTVWSWGINSSTSTGALGDDTTINRSSPVSVVGGFTDWIQVSAGFTHSLGLRANGTAWAWGLGSSGQLGTNNTTNRSSPVSVVGGFTDWVQVSAGNNHSLGLRANGTVWAWGSNSLGRLGDGTTIDRSSPVSVVGGFTDWVQLSGGYTHSLGLRSNGTAWAWGRNNIGQLGDGTFLNGHRSSPVSVLGGFTDWVQVSGGRQHSLGIRANGTAWAWGSNNAGQLGQTGTATMFEPGLVLGGFTDWVQVSAGGYHSLGLRANGTAWAWGINSYVDGILGDGTTINRSSPVSVVGGFTDWVQVDGGSTHSLGLRG